MSWLSHRCSYFFWLSLLCCFPIDEAFNVEIEMTLIRFSNPEQRNALKQCCDGQRDATTCTDSCDVFFAVCVGPPDCKQEWSSDVIFGNGLKTTSSQGNISSSSENTQGNFSSVKFVVNTRETLSIRFYDDDSVQGKPSLANKSSHELIINFTQILPTPINSSTRRHNFSKDGISLEILYRLKCTENWYGELCHRYCKARDYLWDHTTCLANGTEICLPGWKRDPSDRCKIPICLNDCKPNGLTCIKPGVCSCKRGWKEPACTECIPHSKCLHATCTHPNQCDCKKNWTGQFCNVLLDYCSHDYPCENGECFNDNKKNFTCRCCFGWFGRQCDKSLNSSSCNRTNTVCTWNNECRCKVGWQGSDCNQCTPSTNCTHGYCIRPFECLCEKGWRGDKCNETTHSSNCSQRNPCKNDGECKDVGMGGYRCDCKRGFAGTHCENIVSCSTWCNEEHGYCQDNECRCHNGWQGPNCTECVRNSSCVHGYCRQPFECSCNESWTGPFCNVSIKECSMDNSSRCSKTQKIGSDESSSDIERLIYILSSLLVLLLIICILGLVWRQHRRRATFQVQSSEAVGNNIKLSYKRDENREKNMLSLNNNVSVETDLKSYPAADGVLINPMTLQPSQNSRSTLLNNEPEVYETDFILSNDKSPPDSSEYCIIEQVITEELLK